jgi:hypothetical protein
MSLFPRFFSGLSTDTRREALRAAGHPSSRRQFGDCGNPQVHFARPAPNRRADKQSRRPDIAGFSTAWDCAASIFLWFGNWAEKSPA